MRKSLEIAIAKQKILDKKKYDKKRDKKRAENPPIAKEPKPRAPRKSKTQKADRYWVGIDGEGETEGEPWALDTDTLGCVLTGSKHLYTTMSYHDATGAGFAITNRGGLSTLECLTFLVSIPNNAKIMAFGFGYDLTKILEDIPTADLYKLTHPELRLYPKEANKKARYAPVYWKGFLLDLFNTRFKVARARKGRFGFYSKKWNTVHDISKFYQCPFVTACERWEIGSPVERDTMRKMKDDRRNMAAYSTRQILDYSAKECQWGAILAQKLDDAHADIGIDLKGQYYGAGSTAKALMKKWNIEPFLPGRFDNEELPEAVEKAAAFAFFGGRFEIALRGRVEKRIYDLDIASAYPYQIAFLPCLLCGKWSQTTDLERVKEASAALVRYSLGPIDPKPVWGPFPFRDIDGTIPFPVESNGGWVHKDEFLAGAAIFPNVKMKSAWVYETSCSHRPFKEIPNIYLERLRIGKESAGIVLKLGINAVAGSVMQTVGQRRYYNAVWAGMITSGCRAQNLELMARYERLEDLIMIATDGQWGLVLPDLPKPKHTGTDIEVIDKTTGKAVNKPLGSWEKNVFEEGVFMARPGIYFPLGIKDEKGMKDLKARGIGVRTLYEHRDRVMSHYKETDGKENYEIYDKDPFRTIKEKSKPKGVERFIGLKGGIIATSKEIKRRSVYGLWSLQRRMIGFSARPKRDEGDGYRLQTRSLDPKQESMPYTKGKFSAEDILADSIYGDKDADQDDCDE